MIETYCEFTFEAAHRTTPETPLHGHSFRVRVAMTGEPVPVYGWSHNLLEVEPLLDGVRRQLDHCLLNDVEGLDTPTLENVARWVWERLDQRLPGLDRVEVSRGLVGLAEGVVYRGPRR